MFALDKYGVTAIRSDDGRPKFIVGKNRAVKRKRERGIITENKRLFEGARRFEMAKVAVKPDEACYCAYLLQPNSTYPREGER